MVAAFVRMGDPQAVVEYTESLTSDGFVLSLALCAGALPSIAFTVLFAKIRKGITVRQYLCLHRVKWRELIKWSLALVVFMVCSDGLGLLIGRPLVGEFMIRTYQTARFLPLLWLAFIVVAPIREELLFRGFMFSGIQKSRLGAVGAVLISSLVWSALHVQYGLYGVATIFVSGLLFGAARARSGSVYVPIIMHALMNLVASAQVAIYLS